MKERSITIAAMLLSSFHSAGAAVTIEPRQKISSEGF
jgi:hypothetical protein